MASCSILTGGGAASSVVLPPSVFSGQGGITTGNLQILGSAGAGLATLSFSQNTSGGSGAPTNFVFFTSDDSGAGYVANALQLFMYPALPAGNFGFSVFNITQDGTAGRAPLMTMAASLILTTAAYTLTGTPNSQQTIALTTQAGTISTAGGTADPAWRSVILTDTRLTTNSVILYSILTQCPGVATGTSFITRAAGSFTLAFGTGSATTNGGIASFCILSY